MESNDQRKRIAYVDHSFHKKTKSNVFLSELLEDQVEVVRYWDESWRDGNVDEGLVAEIAKEKFDAVVLFQSFWSSEILNRYGLRNVTIVPMYDAVRKQPTYWWFKFFTVRFLNFSKVLHDMLVGQGFESHLVKFYPDPARFQQWCREGNGGMFFWQRGNDVDWKLAKKLMGSNPLPAFHLHWAVDPKCKASKPNEEDSRHYGITYSDWFEDRDEMMSTMANHSIYLAPRVAEGIGMGFLEAMAMGMCVVAPDTPTHNEYIVDGVNGLLYDPKNPQALDFSNVRELGEQAKRECEEGCRRWRESALSLVNFLVHEGENSDMARLSEQMNRIQSSVFQMRSEVALLEKAATESELRKLACLVRYRLRKLLKKKGLPEINS